MTERMQSKFTNQNPTLQPRSSLPQSYSSVVGLDLLTPEGATSTLMDSTGNRTLNQLLHPKPDSPPIALPKLKIGKADNEYEREADRIADQVVEKGLLQRPSVGAEILPSTPVSHRPSPLADGKLGPGQPVPLEIRRHTEGVLGTDFRDVRIHNDAHAGPIAEALGANAFAIGRDIVFAPGRYALGTTSGQKLLVHELTHVAQQQGASPALQLSPDPASERENTLFRQMKDAYTAAMSRYRNWLTNNLSRFLGDVFGSGRPTALGAVRNTFLRSYLITLVGDAFGGVGTTLAARAGARQLASAFWIARRMPYLGGIAAFFAGAIIETIVTGLFDRSQEIARLAAIGVGNIVTELINPAVDAELEALAEVFDDLSSAMQQQDLTPDQWGEVRTAFTEARDCATNAYSDVEDQSLYRQLALSTGVYGRDRVTAERNLPQSLPGTETAFHFTIEMITVEGPTRIVVPPEGDGSIIVIRSHAWNCLVDAPAGPMIREPQGMPLTYTIELMHMIYTPVTCFWLDYHIPRVFRVGSDQYGVWYGVPSGIYRMRILRPYPHAVALCGEGGYWVIAPS